MEKILKQVDIGMNDELLDFSDDIIDKNNGLDDNINNDPTTDLQMKYLKLELANLEKQTMQSKLELEQWRQEAKILENMLKRPDNNTEVLSDIQSDVFSRREESVI